MPTKQSSIFEDVTSDYRVTEGTYKQGLNKAISELLNDRVERIRDLRDQMGLAKSQLEVAQSQLKLLAQNDERRDARVKALIAENESLRKKLGLPNGNAAQLEHEPDDGDNRD